MTDHKPELTLVFIYNADSGFFNVVTDIAHKIFSPDTYACQLCAITHSAFNEKKAWRNFLESLDHPMEFLHRDEFELDDAGVKLPAIYLRREGKLEPWITAAQINQCHSIDDLQQLIQQQLADYKK